MALPWICRDVDREVTVYSYKINEEEKVMAETVTGVIAVRNAAYNENGGINCEVQFEDAVNEKG
ncbi:TPA: hypothetical protein JEX88_005174, partial [Escherichia coli]|nr:hypothetical protein [Escherichia coli]HAU9342225.1 hypothetical protein [Escherichia coli]HAU9342846.1 hypothetical protein [Escherichia coli]